MDLEIISFTIVLVLFILLLFYITAFIFKPYLEKRNEIEEKAVTLDQFELFMQIDVELIEKEIDKMIIKYVNDYSLKKFILQNVDYIRKPDINIMRKEIKMTITLEISELYIFYIKMLTSINNDEDLLKYIDKKVDEHVLLFVTDYNKQPTT